MLSIRSLSLLMLGLESSLAFILEIEFEWQKRFLIRWKFVLLDEFLYLLILVLDEKNMVIWVWVVIFSLFEQLSMQETNCSIIQVFSHSHTRLFNVAGFVLPGTSLPKKCQLVLAG